MSFFKCKMCGAELPVTPESKIVKCDFCGSTQTISILSDEKILKALDRGNKLRNEGEFSKAYSIFEQLIVDGSNDAEIYWNLLLCKYGITYVDDYDKKKIPTMNRMSANLFNKDADFLKCIELADSIAKEEYERQAAAISMLQNKILEISNKEEPFDIFICYKETDEYGDRTNDSVIGQELYKTLVKEGYKVFFSRIALADIIGSEYEPYIYSALYSSKVMLLVTANAEYINSPWVKNEWSRFLEMQSLGMDKILVPCFKGVDPYDFPKEFRNTQGIDFSKLGATQDLLLGLEKIFSKSKKEKKQNNTTSNSLSGMLKRSEMLIEEGDFEKALKVLDTVLNFEPDNGNAYFLLMFCDLKTTKEEAIKNHLDLSSSKFYAKAEKFANEEIRKELQKFVDNRNFYFINKIIDLGKDGVNPENFAEINACYFSIKNYSPAEEKQEYSKIIENLNEIKNKYDLNVSKKIVDKFSNCLQFTENETIHFKEETKNITDIAEVKCKGIESHKNNSVTVIFNDGYSIEMQFFQKNQLFNFVDVLEKRSSAFSLRIPSECRKIKTSFETYEEYSSIENRKNKLAFSTIELAEKVKHFKIGYIVSGIFFGIIALITGGTGLVMDNKQAKIIVLILSAAFLILAAISISLFVDGALNKKKLSIIRKEIMIHTSKMEKLKKEI